MDIPQDIAKAFIHYINENYLSSHRYSNDSEHYLDSAYEIMKNSFTIDWKMGGSYGSCWTDKPVKVEAEDEPEMIELDKFLNEYFEELSYESISHIKSKAETYENSDRDYYGGQQTYAKKMLHFSLLGETLTKILYDDENISYESVDFYSILNKYSEIIIHMSLDEYYNSDIYEKIVLNENLENNLSENEKSHVSKLKI